MSGELPSTHSRRLALQARCESQRDMLSEQVADIEQRLLTTDTVLGSIRNVLVRPTVLAGGLALLLTMGRSGWWSMLSRGVVLLATARRVYRVLKHK